MKVLIVIGTRPEAIKVAGIIYELQRRRTMDWRLCSTGQHKTMLDETLDDLGIAADVDLGIMQRAGSLGELMAAALVALDPVMEKERPDWVLVQGDTATVKAAALAAFYRKIPVAHVEAGLRSHARYSPWPEEINRKVVSAIATHHFAPTGLARDNLLREGISAADIDVTGNTVIDALLEMRERTRHDPAVAAEMAARCRPLANDRPIVLVTGHRRENFGDGFRQICVALQRLARRGDVEIIYPVHLNPHVRGPVFEMLGAEQHIHLIEPLRYSRFVHLMDRAHIILTDSGGIQEEAPSLGKPVLVMRDTSERPEAIEAGTARLVGTSAQTIFDSVSALLADRSLWGSMCSAVNPYGDGKASGRIVNRLEGRTQGDSIHRMGSRGE